MAILKKKPCRYYPVDFERYTNNFLSCYTSKPEYETWKFCKYECYSIDFTSKVNLALDLVTLKLNKISDIQYIL